MSKKLLQFKTLDNGDEKEFVFYGNYHIKQILPEAGYALFTIMEEEDSIELFEVSDGKEIPYQIQGQTWAGYQYDTEDAFRMTWMSMSQGMVQSLYKFSYVDPGIQAVIDGYKEIFVKDKNGDKIQQYILYREPEEPYELSVATADELYYINVPDAGIVLFGRKGKEVRSDNSFAEGAYLDILYGEDPENSPILYLRKTEAEILKENR